jgi:hypothetical protein
MLQPLMVISVNEIASRAHAYGEASSFNEGLLDMSQLFRAQGQLRQDLERLHLIESLIKYLRRGSPRVTLVAPSITALE